MNGVLTNDERHEQMELAIGRFPFLKKQSTFGPNKVSIVCFGPSLADTWRQIKPLDQSIITVSGAHDFLVDRNVIPTWHVEIDPRPHKPQMLRNPREETRYLMASVCHPDFWEILNGYDVQLWHLINGDDYATVDWVREHHPEGLNAMIGGGSTVGQRAMNVAAALGFRRFDIFGMDCSFTEKRHAGWHSGGEQASINIAVRNRTFQTTPQLLQSACEMEKFCRTMDAEITFHGDGLLQELAQRTKKRSTA